MSTVQTSENTLLNPGTSRSTVVQERTENASLANSTIFASQMSTRTTLGRTIHQESTKDTELTKQREGVSTNDGARIHHRVEGEAHSINNKSNVSALIVDSVSLKYMYLYIGGFYLSVVIVVLFLDGLLPRICGEQISGGGAPTTEMLHSIYDEQPRPVVHNIPPGFEGSTSSRMLPPHNNG
ncbi:unnamed protein product [Thelazia callipaeda]|uniref:Uncharacterized protein n=1 Tax=Thelazia callipaeda TaxID=103827 RepID=A0A0N5CZ96_THECL|nr:unnamed protein product [Thelazia callipaeda]